MLTTRCPHCSTVFRIKPEQLSVRGGRVRCGHCQQPFSALAHLEELDDETPLSPPAPRQPVSPATAVVAPTVPAPAPASVSIPAPAPAPIFPAALDPRPEPVVSSIPAMTASQHAKPWPVPEADLPAPGISDVAATQTLILPEPEPEPSAVEAPSVGDDFSMRIRLDGPSPAEVRGELGGELDFDFAEIEDDTPATATTAPAAYTSQVARDLGVPAYDPEQALVFGQTVMLEEPIEIAGIAAPEFDHGPESLFAEHERQQHPAGQVEDRRRGHAGLWRWLVGVLLLVILGAVQLAYVFRTDLTRWLPESRPLLEEACVVLGCDVPYPQIIADDLIVIESSGFTPDSTQEGRFRLVASILNKANFHQAWPHLELTITDRFDIAIARRVLKPAEWLPPAYASLPAFEAHSEVTANLSLDLGKLAASGYRLYVFYP